MQIPIIAFRGRKKPWPSIPRINWNHPITNELSSYCYDVGGTVIDLVSGRIGKRTSATGTLSRAVTRFGNAIGYSAGQAAISLPPQSVGKRCQAAPFSMCCGIYSTVAPGTLACAFGYADTASNVTTIIVLNSTTQINVVTGNSTGDTYTVPNFVGDFHTILCVATASAKTIQYYDGVVVATGTPGTDVSLPTVVPCFNTSQSNGTPQNNMTGAVYFGAVWDRALSQAEATLMYKDPYSFLVYPEDEIFATLVGTAAVTTSEDQWHADWSSIRRRYAIIGAG